MPVLFNLWNYFLVFSIFGITTYFVVAILSSFLWTLELPLDLSIGMCWQIQNQCVYNNNLIVTKFSINVWNCTLRHGKVSKPGTSHHSIDFGIKQFGWLCCVHADAESVFETAQGKREANRLEPGKPFTFNIKIKLFLEHF